MINTIYLLAATILPMFCVSRSSGIVIGLAILMGSPLAILKTILASLFLGLMLDKTSPTVQKTVLITYFTMSTIWHYTRGKSGFNLLSIAMS